MKTDLQTAITSQPDTDFSAEMNTTFSLQRSDISDWLDNQQPLHCVLNQWPFLKKQMHILQHFKQLMDWDALELCNANVDKVVAAVFQHFQSESRWDKKKLWCVWRFALITCLYILRSFFFFHPVLKTSKRLYSLPCRDLKNFSMFCLPFLKRKPLFISSLT